MIKDYFVSPARPPGPMGNSTTLFNAAPELHEAVVLLRLVVLRLAPPEDMGAKEALQMADQAIAKVRGHAAD